MDQGAMPAVPKGSGKHPVCWLEFLYKDAEASQQFYSDLFGWNFTPFQESYFIFQPSSGVMGGFSGRTPEGPYCPVAYVFVPDVTAALEKVVAAGGTKLTDKEVVDPETGGGIAFFKDPAGVTMGLADMQMDHPPVPSPFGPGEKPEHNTICSIELFGGTLTSTGEFYRALFGWATQETMPQYMAFDAGAGIGGVFQSHTPAAPVVPYVYVSDVHEKLEQVARLGGKTLGDPMKVPGFGTFGYFTDPSGLALGLIGP